MHERFSIDAKPYFYQFYVEDVLAIKAARDYCFLVTIDGKEILITKQLGQIEKELKNQNFKDASSMIRLSRSLIVNFNHITEFDMEKRPKIKLQAHIGMASISFFVPKRRVKQVYDNLKNL